MNVSDSLKFTGKDPSIKGRQRALLLKALETRLELNKNIKRITTNELAGKTPNVFVGSFGYPNVSAGFLSTHDYNNEDNPLEWSHNPEKYKLLDIVALRSSLVNSRFSSSIKDLQGKHSDKLKEISLAIKPVDSEIKLEKAPYFKVFVGAEELPHGPSVGLKAIRVTENPKIPRLIDKYESDTDLKASKAVSSLFEKGFDEHYLTKIFSAGNLGVKIERKLVPTRWSITAVDDTVGKEFIKEAEHFNPVEEPMLFTGGYMGNYYYALIFPGPWSFELFETYVGPGLADPKHYDSSTDFEGPFGRKTYASNTVGGYYASRLACLEMMRKQKIKGRVLLLRFITDEYWVPLGVWVVREASRNTFSSTPAKFEENPKLMNYIRLLLLKRYNLDVSVIYGKSALLKELRNQPSLNSFY